jgi:hypothetical protein
MGEQFVAIWEAFSWVERSVLLSVGWAVCAATTVRFLNWGRGPRVDSKEANALLFLWPLFWVCGGFVSGSLF